MKRIMSAVLLSIILATPAFAAKVYLKDGGVIQAKRVWREGGKVHVLATRHTLTSFEPSEINLKRTFAKRHKTVRKVAAVQPQAVTPPAAPNAATSAAKPAEKKPAVKLPALPKLPEKPAESTAPAGGGTIKQHKKEMADKTAE